MLFTEKNVEEKNIGTSKRKEAKSIVKGNGQSKTEEKKLKRDIVWSGSEGKTEDRENLQRIAKKTILGLVTGRKLKV